MENLQTNIRANENKSRVLVVEIMNMIIVCLYHQIMRKELSKKIVGQTIVGRMLTITQPTWDQSPASHIISRGYQE